MCAFCLLCDFRGITSREVAEFLSAAQKSARFMRRIRMTMKDLGGEEIGGNGPVEVDETFVGGKVKKMHKSKRPKIMQGSIVKPIVVEMLKRHLSSEYVE